MLVEEKAEGSDRRLTKGDEPELDFVTLASNAEGHTASDMSDLVEGAMQQAMIRTAHEDSSKVRGHL